MRQFLIASCLALLPSLVLPTIASAEPGYFRVTGVAHNDTLNIRAQPDGGATDIGDLAFNARAVEVLETDPSGRWGKIIHLEGMGWVAMRYLEPDQVPMVAGTTLPVGLRCGGTEPFWSLSFNADQAVYSQMGGADVPLSLHQAGPATARQGFPTLMTHFGTGGFLYSLIRPQLCSDGMSDRDYPWDIDLIIEGGTYLEGCCHLPMNNM